MPEPKTVNTINIGESVKVGPNQPLLLISGPCQIESYDHCCLIVEKIQNAIEGLPFSFVFKSSYDKANRTALNSKRGPGIEEGLEILSQVKQSCGVPVVSDIHSEGQASIAGEVLDVLQIPAFLCRQTDLLIAAGKTNKAVNVKKGQFLHPSDMAFCAEKIASTGNKNIMLCERGTCFGYRDLVVDPRNFVLMAECKQPVIFDATHSVMSMGSAGGTSGGSRRFIPPLARAAVATGVHGLFIETHQDPDQAPSDGPSMLDCKDLRPLLEEVARIHQAVS